MQNHNSTLILKSSVLKYSYKVVIYKLLKTNLTNSLGQQCTMARPYWFVKLLAFISLYLL